MSQVQLDLPAPLEREEKMVKDSQGHRDPLDHLVLLVTLHLENLELQVDPANLEPQVHLDIKEILVHLVLKAPEACLVLLVALDQQAFLQQANLDQLVCQEQGDHRVLQVLKDIQVFLVRQDKKEKEVLGFRGHKVREVHQDQWALPESPVSLVLEDLANLEFLVNQVNQAHLAVMGNLDPWVHKVQKVKQVLLELECLASQVIMVPQVCLALSAQKVHKVQLVLLALLVFQVMANQVNPVQKVRGE